MLYAWNGMMPPVALIFSFCPSPPTILGMLGPWMSMSAMPTSLPRSARLTARFVVTVLLPTPPLLLMTRILWRMTDIRLFTSQRLCPSLSFWQVSFSSQMAQAHRSVQGWEGGWEMMGISPGMSSNFLGPCHRYGPGPAAAAQGSP